MTRPLLLLASITSLLTFGCDDAADKSPDEMPPVECCEPAAQPEPAAEPEPAANPRADLVIEGGDVEGVWCGDIDIRGTVTVPAGAALTLCAGTHVRVAADPVNGVVILGRLTIEGTAAQPVRIDSDGPWSGLQVGGTLDATGFVISGGARCVVGDRGAQIDLRDGRMEDCRTPLSSAAGARLTRVDVLGGGSVRVSDGLLEMTDSVVDLRHETVSPDCIVVDGGGARFEHVRVTGCHCPLHFNAAPDGIEATNSIFDGATYPVMLTRTRGAFTGNHFAGTSDHFLDIGGNFEVDIAGNYFEGAAPRLSSGNLGHFLNAADWSRQPFDGVGPRDR